MLKPGISAIEAGIRLAFLPYPSWEDFDQLHDDLLQREKNNKSNPRLVPNHIKSPEHLNPKLKKGTNTKFENGDVLEYDEKHDNGGVFIVNSMNEAYRNADLIVATYESQIKHSSNKDGRSTLCLSDPRTTSIDRKTRFTVPSIEAWCMDQGYQLPPSMDDETLKIFLDQLSPDPETQFDSAFDLITMIDTLNQELTDPQPTNRHSLPYQSSYIYALTKLQRIFDNPEIKGGDILIPPPPFVPNGANLARSVVDESESNVGSTSPFNVFRDMANLSFKEVEFIINTDRLLIRVNARSKQVSVAYSDLGLTNKKSKVTLNAQGKLFLEMIKGLRQPRPTDTDLKKLTRSLKNAFASDESPFDKGKPKYKSRIPEDDEAKRKAEKYQASFNDEIHSPIGLDTKTDEWMKSQGHEWE